MKGKLPKWLMDWKEWHSFVVGWSEGFCLFRSLAVFSPKEERHYYRFGQAIGFASFFIFIFLLVGGFLWYLN